MNLQTDHLCIVAIARDEERFLDEWILYHKLIGVAHFFIYDDSPALALKTFLSVHQDYVTVVDWHENHGVLPGRNRQTKAYLHAVHHLCQPYQWVAFIDIDEFIVLKKHPSLTAFLAGFGNAGSISLHWSVFGHCGNYSDPPAPITASLVRRCGWPSRNIKTITRTSLIEDIQSVHLCKIKKGSVRVDANNRHYKEDFYDGKCDVAHIHHYQCRSFETWMKRVSRGDTHSDEIHSGDSWRNNEAECLKQFVQTVAKDKNEVIDNFMVRYRQQLTEELFSINIRRNANYSAVIK